jgi:predicted transposase YbfD/YdcC
VKGSGNDVLVQVKENQAQLLDDCRVVARNETPLDIFVAAPEKAHGRMEYRECRVFDCAYTTDPQWQPLIARIVEVKRVRECRDAKSKQWKEVSETAFYIATTPRSAEQYHHIVRGHWGIENRLHYVRDNTLREDASRIRHNPGIMARCRSFTLNILRANNTCNIAETLYQNALNFKNLKQFRSLWT